MMKKEVNMKDGRKYIIGITETKNYINCYILEKKLIGYRKVFHHESWKTLIPDYDYAELCTICDYEQKLKDKQRLIAWSLS